MATFRPFIGRGARGCVSLTCTYVSEHDGSQSGLSPIVAFSDTTLRDPPESGCGEPASDGTSLVSVVPRKRGFPGNAPAQRRVQNCSEQDARSRGGGSASPLSERQRPCIPM